MMHTILNTLAYHPKLRAKKNRFIIGPSQLGWLLNDCERCFTRDVVHGVRRPGKPPDVFNIADGAMKRRFDGGPEIVHDLGFGQPFSIIAQGLHVESQPYVDECGVELVLRGRLDALVRMMSGDVIVCDYKTLMRSDVESCSKAYSPQLHAYRFALHNPKLISQRTHVDGLALLIYHPSEYAYRTERQIGGLYGTNAWVEVPTNDDKFQGRLHRVALLLNGDVQPKPNPVCAYCVYYGAVPTSALADTANFRS